MSKKQIIQQAQSKSTLLNFSWNVSGPTVFPDFNLRAVIEMINEDPVARGAFMHFVDKCMEGDYAIISRSTQKYDRALELTLDEKFKFRNEVQRKLFASLLLFNNAFIEIVRDSENITKAINVLDTEIIEPTTSPNGDPLNYSSRIADPTTGKFPTWSPNDIVWVKLNDMSKGWAPIDVKAIWTILNIKQYILRYTGWLWESGQYRVAHNLKDSGDKDVESFLAYNRLADRDFKKPFLAKGEYSVSMIRDMKEAEYYIAYLKYLDSQILINLRVPPIDAGIPDASGRSNADAQSNNLGSRIISVKKAVEDAINYDLFPKINKSNSLLRYSPTDRFAEKQVFEIVQMMKAAGMTDDVITEFMTDRGVVFETEELFNEMPQEGIDNPRENDSAPSRQGKGTGEGNSKIGTGSQGTTRDDQL